MTSASDGQMLPNTWSTNVMNPQHFELTLSTIKLPAEARSWSVAWGCLKARSSRFHFWNWDTRGSKWLETTPHSPNTPSTQAGLPSSRSSDSRPPQHVQFWVCIPADPRSPRSRSDRCNRQTTQKNWATGPVPAGHQCGSNLGSTQLVKHRWVGW